MAGLPEAEAIDTKEEMELSSVQNFKTTLEGFISSIFHIEHIYPNVGSYDLSPLVIFCFFIINNKSNSVFSNIPTTYLTASKLFSSVNSGNKGA